MVEVCKHKLCNFVLALPRFTSSALFVAISVRESIDRIFFHQKSTTMFRCLLQIFWCWVAFLFSRVLFRNSASCCLAFPRNITNKEYIFSNCNFTEQKCYVMFIIRAGSGHMAALGKNFLAATLQYQYIHTWCFFTYRLKGKGPEAHYWGVHFQDLRKGRTEKFCDLSLVFLEHQKDT